MTDLMIRVFSGGVLQSADRVRVMVDELDEVLPVLAEAHGRQLAMQPGHIEIEFLDEPDYDKRFFRIGTDSGSMANPYMVDLTSPEDLEAALKKWRGR